MMKKITLFFFIIIICNGLAWSQDGSPDTSFGNNGRVQTDILGNDEMLEDWAYDIAQDNTGALFVVGYIQTNDYNQSILAKYNIDGSLNLSFGDQGLVSFDYGTQSIFTRIITLPDNKIICGGSIGPYNNSDYTLTKFLSDGVIDNSFGTNGRLVPFLNEGSFSDWIFLDNGGFYIIGSIMIDGISHFILKRYFSNGILDNSFGINGQVTISVGNESNISSSGKLADDGKIILNGRIIENGETNKVLLRLLQDGALDTTFGTNGAVTIAIESRFRCSFALFSDGDIALLCSDYNLDIENVDTRLIRYNSDGTINSSFGDNGYVNPNNSPAYPFKIIIQEDQKILTLGTYANFFEEGGPTYINRYLPNGSLDNTFNYSVAFEGNYQNNFILQEDGKIVAIGSSPWYTGYIDFVLERYNNSPLSVEEFILDNLKIYPSPSKDIVTISSATYLNNTPFSLSDISGKLVKTGFLSGNDAAIQLSNLEAGIYVLKIVNSNFRIIKL